jgi:hypothetical protein
MSKLALILAVLVALSSCSSVTGPCDDSDPTGICASSHGKECVC